MRGLENTTGEEITNGVKKGTIVADQCDPSGESCFFGSLRKGGKT